MIVSLIVAASENNVIGIKNQLPWHLPNDMRFFKNTTWGMPVIMGRKTFESMGGKALPGRKNIIITSKVDWHAENVSVTHTFNDAVKVAQETDSKEVFVIGGGEVFKEVINKANRIYITRVHVVLEGDVFFPVIDEKKWTLVSKKDCFADDKHKYDYTFELWEKK